MNTRSRPPYPARTMLWLMLLIFILAGCTLFDNGNKDNDLEETIIALAVKQTDLAQQALLDDPNGTPTLALAGSLPVEQTAAALAVTQTAMAAAAQPPTPDLPATQVAISVQQTLAAGGSSGIPAGGTPTTLALPGIAPSETPPTYQAGPGFSNFTDNFLDPTSGWPVQSSGANQWWYANDHYYISVGSANTQVVVTPGYTLADGYVIASGAVTQDQPKAYYGVVCRFQDLNNYYFFEYGLDGYYQIGKMWNGQWSLIGMGQPKYSIDANKSQSQYNQITGHCHSNDLTLYVNDIFVETVYDNTFATGQIGLSVSTGDFPGMTAAFDFIIAEE